MGVHPTQTGEEGLDQVGVKGRKKYRRRRRPSWTNKSSSWAMSNGLPDLYAGTGEFHLASRRPR